MKADAYLFNTGKNYQSYRFLGAFPDIGSNDEAGYRFAVWAPHAAQVCVAGDFNAWDNAANPLTAVDTTGIWQGFVPGAKEWRRYKYAVTDTKGRVVLKADPYTRHAETRPGTASVLYDTDDGYEWEDQAWMEERPDALAPEPLNIYEIQLGSWRRYPDGNLYNYRDIAPQLAEYCNEMGFNAIELMPITEYPLDDSWGYQVSGYFAPTSRFGTPADFKVFVDIMHEHGIRVILDWVPAHFPRDAFGLARFDGTPTYEYADTRLGEHDEWGTLVFDFSKAEVVSFLISSAWFWLDEYHIDGLRVDAVSSMLYLDYSRTEAVRNKYGGNENLEAIDFLRTLNTVVHESFPSVMMIAEESTAFPLVTTSPDEGGLGFTQKWNMGWMHDTLDYMTLDYLFRKDHHNQVTFSMTYAFSERYILAFSHDEVVHGKRSLIERMPGDIWRKFASFRTMLMYQMAHPGLKLIFMGYEFAQFVEWRFYEELQWFMLQYPRHDQTKTFVKELNHLYLDESALWEDDHSWDGFEWLQADDNVNSVLAFVRKGTDPENQIIALLNMTPATIPGYRFKITQPGRYRIILCSDDIRYDGSGYLAPSLMDHKFSSVPADPNEDPSPPWVSLADVDAYKLGELSYLEIDLPPLCGIYFKIEEVIPFEPVKLREVALETDEEEETTEEAETIADPDVADTRR